MTDYPYDFGNGYKVQTVYANKTETRVYGDIYDFRSEVERAHPGAEIMTGYCVIDEALGLIPDGCNDWNDSISAAIQDYEEHVAPFLNADRIAPSYFQIPEEALSIARKMLDPDCLEPYYILRPQFMKSIPGDKEPDCTGWLHTGI